MKALINFSSYPKEEQKVAAFKFLVFMAGEYGWTVEQTGDVDIFWTTGKPCLLADTTAQTIVAAVGDETVAQTFDGMTQAHTILGALVASARTGMVLGGIRWSFSHNGDVYANKTLISSADVVSIIDARTAAMV